MSYPPSDVPAFVFWLMPDEDPAYEDWPHSTPLHAWQRGRCAMCQVSDSFFDANLVKDHDHGTGKVRGLLCRGCNSAEPHSDSPAFVAWRAGLTPATAIGYDKAYSGPAYSRAAEVRAGAVVGDETLDQIAAAMV